MRRCSPSSDVRYEAEEVRFGGYLRCNIESRGGILAALNAMLVPESFKIIENCVTCPHRAEQIFCDLPLAAVRRLDAITTRSSYPTGAMLFVEGESPRGVFIICNGKVKLSTSSADGRTLITRISAPGEILGLPATVTGKPYELTAELIEPTQANFISRVDFLNFASQNGIVALRAAQQLAEIYQSAILEVRNIGLSHSAAEKLARVLLDFSAKASKGKSDGKIRMTLTHEEIAQMIGSSRETVTRLLSDFKKKDLLEVRGSTLILKNKAGLESLLVE